MEYGDDCMNLRMLALKTEKLLDFLRSKYKLFHSIMVDGKDRVEQNLCIWKLALSKVVNVVF